MNVGTSTYGVKRLERICEVEMKLITVRLTFLSHSVRIRPNFQGLPWFKCYRLGKMNY
jgi:hypothetical protein